MANLAGPAPTMLMVKPAFFNIKTKSYLVSTFTLLKMKRKVTLLVMALTFISAISKSFKPFKRKLSIEPDKRIAGLSILISWWLILRGANGGIPIPGKPQGI
uniref:Uncharacterized protein n=1 Tax=Haematobia irritans TaxID=7368 RepID=A0A1L8E6R2_HAEIR